MNKEAFTQGIQTVKDWLKKEYQSIRTGVATPAVLDGVRVTSYGAKAPLNQVASVSSENAKTLYVNVYDKSQIKEIENAIINSGLGLSASANENGVRVSFPDLTVERKTMLIKLAKEKLEAARVSLRSERDRYWNDIQEREKTGEISEDEKFSLKEKMEEEIRKAGEELNEILNTKEAEISQKHI